MSTFSGFPEEALIFFEGLDADNSRTYWNDHRPQYESSVRAPMLALAALLEPEFGELKLFRPYRDVRFSADKRPYKTQLGASTTGGQLRYVHVGVDGLVLAGGMYSTQSDQVERLRAAVASDRTGPVLERIVADLRAAGYRVGGQQLKTRPRGYDADHPRIELLRHKTLFAGMTWNDPPWLSSPECADRIVAGWRELGPLVDWLSTHVGPTRLELARRR